MALRHYWTLINQGKYVQAFAMETANEQGKEPSFVSDKTQAQPMINIVFIGTPSSNHGDANVPIKFYAQDRYPSPASNTQCRFFDMTAHMVQTSDGSWSYDGPSSANVSVPRDTSNCHG